MLKKGDADENGGEIEEELLNANDPPG